MKIIHYIASIDEGDGGTTEYMRLLSLYLSKHCDLTVVAGLSPKPIEIKAAEVKLVNTSIHRYMLVKKEFKKILIQIAPDLVHINGIWTPQNWWFQKAAKELNIKVILSPHGMLEPWILARNPIKKRVAMFLYQNKAIKRANYLHVTAQLEAENIRKLGYKNLLISIPNGIDVNEIKKMKSVYGTKKMVFFSRIHPKKGIELLLEAWKQIDTKGWNLEIAGNGEKTYIKQLKESANELQNVDFVGVKYDEDKWDFLRSADVMVLPTHSENFGIVVAEALAVGVPVITTKGTPWEDLNKHKCGWWIQLTNSELKQTLIKAMQTSEEDLQMMGRNGIDLIAEKYDIKAVAMEMNKIYKEILNLD